MKTSISIISSMAFCLFISCRNENSRDDLSTQADHPQHSTFGRGSTPILGGDSHPNATHIITDSANAGSKTPKDRQQWRANSGNEKRNIRK